MDTKTLVVGKKVVMDNGPYLAGLGTVVKVTPKGAIVRLERSSGPVPEPEYALMQFDANGKVCDSTHLGYKGTKNADGLPCSFECCDPFELTTISADDFYRANGGKAGH